MTKNELGRLVHNQAGPGYSHMTHMQHGCGCGGEFEELFDHRSVAVVWDQDRCVEVACS